MLGPDVFDRGCGRHAEVGARVGRTSHVATAGTHLVGVLVLLLGLAGIGWLVIPGLTLVVLGSPSRGSGWCWPC